MEEDYNNNNVSSVNSDYVGYSAMQIRLDTTDILRKIEMYLRGQYDSWEVDKKTREPVMVVKNIGVAKANTRGVQSIMSWLTSLINTQVVQGNIPTHNDLGEVLCQISNDLTDYLYINSKNFGIDDKELNGVVDMVMNNLRFFLSRSVGDGERKSYANTIKTTESSNNTVRGRGFSMPIIGGFGGR